MVLSGLGRGTFVDMVRKLVLLDAGGVVIDGKAEKKTAIAISTVLGLDPEEVISFFRKEVYLPASIGVITEEEALARVAEAYGEFDTEIIREVARSSTIALPDIEAVLSSVSSCSSLWMLSNAVSVWLLEHLKRHQLAHYFERILVSSDIRMRKPDSEAFQLVLDLWGQAADTIVFVDDKQENLEVAESMGMSVVLAKGNAKDWAFEVDKYLS